MGGGTMRNSRGELNILVLFKAISLKTFYMNIYTTTRKSRGGVPRCHYIFQFNTEFNNIFTRWAPWEIIVI